ncbi:MAG: GAF domain-containing protein [Chloroflexi bacterium]|nr:MAG: GAF domain-containing protein [Chloroflexota bacterium]
MQNQLNLLNRISDELNKDLDPDKMLRRVLNLTVSHLNATTGSVMLFDQHNRVSAFILQQENLSDDRASRIVGTVLTEGFAGWVLKHGQSGIIYDTYQDSRWVVYDNQPYDVRSAIATPLRRRERVIGVLTVVHDEPNQFQEKDLLLLNAIAGQAAIALENARLFKETEQERVKLSAIINNTQDAVLMTTPDNRVALLNPAAEELLKTRGKPWEGVEISALTDNTALLKLLSPDGPTTGEVPLPDNRTLWATVTTVPGMGRVMVLRDISAFKELDRMKRNFIQAFTHDLRTPLATVKGYMELLRMDGPLTDRQEEDLVGIARAADQMKVLIEDMLELSRLEQLEELAGEPVAIRDVVRKSVSQMETAAKAKNIQIQVDMPEAGDMLIEGNAVLLGRAVGNLLDNAIKYTPTGGEVRVVMRQNGGRVVVSVQDNGPGIAARDLPRVFEKFFRARQEMDDIPGSGLGLAIVKTIVEHHRGQVWVESQPGQGSVFSIELPLHTGD